MSKRIAILGAGPTGLEAAHALTDAGHDVHLYERGQVGDNVRLWGHVTLFSPWSLNTSELGRSVLDDLELPLPPGDEFPTGAEFVRDYVEPLARHPRLEGRVHERTNVVSVGRESVIKGELIGSAKRRTHKFRLLLEDDQLQERIEHADVVIDSTGTYGNANMLGDANVPAIGERKARREGFVSWIIPDVLGKDRQRYAGRHTVVIGAGYSAATVLAALRELGATNENTRVTWVLRQSETPYHRVADDPLPQRDVLAAAGNALADGKEQDARVNVVTGRSIHAIELSKDGKLCLRTMDGTGALRETIDEVDHIVANVGFRPDPSIYRELQIHQCYASEGPMKLAAALLAADGGGSGDCLAQTSAGPEALVSPEPDFYILGAKSYGRRSDYLLKLGVEQIADLMSLLS